MNLFKIRDTNNRRAGLLLAVLLMLYSFYPQRKIRIFLAGDSTMSIKEPRAYPETGWGMPFVNFWDSTVEVINRAKNGRSTKTFISEGLWKSIAYEAGDGDYVFIQFGHNDESKDKKERYSTPDTFRMNLRRFILETRQKNAIPVLLTPVSRRKFDSSGTALESHLEYSSYVREVANSEKVLFIDLDEKSRSLYQRLGKDKSMLLFLQLLPGENPNYPGGITDNTHFNELGARMIAELVLEDLRLQHIELTSRVVVPKMKS